jgi:hypothetical protein
MIKLKKENPVFSKPAKTTLSLGGTVKSIILESTDLNVVMYGNFGLSNVGNIPLSFPKTGKWYNYFTGEEFNIASATVNFNFRSSEFYLFTDKKLLTPKSGILQVDFVTDIPKEIKPTGAFRLYPVPTSGWLTIELPVEMAGSNYRILDLTGRTLLEGVIGANNQKLELDVRNIKVGIYIFEAYDTKNVLVKRFIKR